MTLTPTQVIEELAKTGRHVEPRTLTDWRTRGLLPKLTERGQGQGRGKAYFWTDADILDRVALIADLPSWATDRTILALWSCGFKVSAEQVKKAWIKSIEQMSRQVAKQDMDAPFANSAQLPYFERLEDALHTIATSITRQKKAEGDAISEYSYDLTQLGFSFYLAKVVQDNFEEELEYINSRTSRYIPPFAKNRDYHFPEIDADFILSIRKFANIFEIRKAIQSATQKQFETAQFIWKAICRVFAQLSPEEPRSEIGLTTGRMFLGTFGPVTQSLIIVVLQTQKYTALVRAAELIASRADELEAAQRRGLWPGRKGALHFWTEKRPELAAAMEDLWWEFLEGINRSASQQK